MKQNHKNKITDKEISEAYKKTPHIGKLCVQFNLPNITIWRRLKKLGLVVKRIGNNVKIPLQEILEGKHPYYQTFKLNKRLIKEKIFDNECSICYINSWNKKPIKMQLDHINGNSTDHTLKNLRLICPNCHSQTETYCGKNK
jgi:hypothetical protein